MAREAAFQSKVISFLRRKGCYVVKLNQDAKSSVGDPDLFFCYKNLYGFCEIKKSQDASFRPLQKEKLAMLKKWTFAEAVYPENFGLIKERLEALISDEDM